ncbi:SDR family oxidoreductase [Paenibacillus glucanolyticus]|uniref:SDR family oxidoreductase n=1 Tax=Paenibacillus glucanolyticus TaxID=59843 RepID=UPI0036B18C56
MTILVTGATGNVGRHVVEELLKAGHKVRALSRYPASAKLPAAVEVVGGDLSNPDTLVPALEGVSGLHLITTGTGYVPLTTGKEIIAATEQQGFSE